MQLYRLIMPVLLSAPLSLGLACAHAETTDKSTTTTTTTVITTAVPAPKAVVVEPEGYVSCTSVPAGWKNDVWYTDYKVCRYDTKSETVKGEAWIGGHWQCSEYTSGANQSECTNWEWADGRWVTTYAEVQ